MKANHQHSFVEDKDNQHRGGRRSRLFEAGRIKLLVLYLIQQQPKHGYEVIKAISDLVGGGYTPSAGTIYPTLNTLEEAGLIITPDAEAEPKQYQITEAGQLHLQQQQDLLDKLLEKLQMKRSLQENDQYRDIYRAMENLKTALRLQLAATDIEQEKIYSIAEKIDQVAVAIGRL
ncbi:PadR family transcriptional regulator [Acinetobacter puyangensis]|uniref:Transcriptional regulator, PadR family n=1 Tax=Acinetobacter puyangensis TaxID=1096779 RepID=A0A240EBH6_9GAMM|nr:PadR family transcriptional regulator [Acinetobacter puyangensis]SNX46054.1 transcriptional regulator, PadR family [Acinetobacter puyangensis]